MENKNKKVIFISLIVLMVLILSGLLTYSLFFSDDKPPVKEKTEEQNNIDDNGVQYSDTGAIIMPNYTSPEETNNELFKSSNENPLNIEAFLKLKPEHKIGPLALYNINDELIYADETLNVLPPNNKQNLEIFILSKNLIKSNMEFSEKTVKTKLIENKEYKNVQLQNNPYIIQGIIITGDNENNIEVVTTYSYNTTAEIAGVKKNIIYSFIVSTNFSGSKLYEEELFIK